MFFYQCPYNVHTKEASSSLRLHASYPKYEYLDALALERARA